MNKIKSVGSFHAKRHSYIDNFQIIAKETRYR